MYPLWGTDNLGWSLLGVSRSGPNALDASLNWHQWHRVETGLSLRRSKMWVAE